MKKCLLNTPPAILLLLLAIVFPLALSAQIDFGKTYVDSTKSATGGTVEPGDVIEIRATFVVKSGTFDSCAFFDVVPVGTTYIAGSLAVLTNEGKKYKTFTDASGDDAGFVTGSNIRINLGFNPASAPATAFKRGRIKNTDKPSFYSSTCIMIASYRVRVTAVLGSTIDLGGGFVTHKSGAGPILTTTFSSDNVAVFTNSGVCSNSVGANAISAEFGGTFGSGKNKNRGTSASVPSGYTYDIFTQGGPQDYFYGISNNTSTGKRYTTSNTWKIPDPGGNAPNDTSHRVFTVWDIIGDHTGASNPLLGNPPADTVNGTGGYMLVINSAYKTDTAFSYTVSNLCPNTYYELSAWIRNICSLCGCDSNGKGATTAGYIATVPGPAGTADSSGVYPNLTYGIDGKDYYSTGYIKYTGQWTKKGFTYLTGPSQTSFTLTIRNNAPGGGGNDWAIDDISIATCTPNLDMRPSPNVNVCYGNTVDMSCVVRCYYPNYIYWEWQKSTDGGLTWTNTGVKDTATGPDAPVLVAGQWQYTAAYPTFLGDSSQNHVTYRIKIASTAANLADDNCSFAATSFIQVWVNNCLQPLSTKLLSFTGKNENSYAHLLWSTDNETGNTQYEVERSLDGAHFTSIATIPGSGFGGGAANYTFNDPDILKGATYYRIKMVEGANYRYSKVITLNESLAKFELKSVVNPFDNSLTFDIVTPDDKQALISLTDIYGKQVKVTGEHLFKGFNRVTINDLAPLSKGIYILRIVSGGQVLNTRVMKAGK